MPKTIEEKKAYLKEYYVKNKERIKEKRKIYQAKNREKINQQSKEWAKKNFEKNPDKVREARHLKKIKYKAKDPQRYNELLKKWNLKCQRAVVEELKDSYVQRLLKRRSAIKEVPQELIEAKRLQILIRRFINEKRN